VWHSLRHVFCTTALFTWKLEAVDVSRMAGHANVRITLDMYVGATAGVLDCARAAAGCPRARDRRIGRYGAGAAVALMLRLRAGCYRVLHVIALAAVLPSRGKPCRTCAGSRSLVPSLTPAGSLR
jgi:hypothetical protein